MENKNVMIKNLINSRVGINVPDLRLNRVWEKKGAVKPIAFDTLAQAIYDPSVEYLFKEGILGIDDMAVKIELGLEPEDAVEPVNIITLDDNQMDRFLNKLPINEFKAEIRKLPIEQIRNLVDYAIDNECANFDKAEILKEITEIDIMQAIKNRRIAKED